MFVEFYNVTQDKAYYACGTSDDIFGVIINQNTLANLVNCGGDSEEVLHRILPTLNRLTDLEPADSFQVRLFTTEPDSHVLTKRIQIRGIYWANWNSRKKDFDFEKVN